ncbi:MAG: cation-translocating P-type ATPase, partial [Vicinamibacterales bacterium]
MTGLTTAEATAKRQEVGANALPAAPPTPFWRRFLRQFQSPLVYILLFALAFDAGLWLYEGAAEWPLEALAIALILAVNAALGLYQERRSEAALARLTALAGAHAWVLRDGQFARLPVDEIVPGDVVRLEAGDRIPADGTLGDAHGVMVDESVLTGESVPVDKGDAAEAMSGTLLVRGHAVLTVTRTGAASAMGRMAAMLGGIQAGQTPLERRVERLGRQLARWVLLLAGALCAIGLAAEGLGRAPDVIIFAVSLAVAAVPEGLPAVLTVALALGVERMARQRAVVRRLAAVEALGSITVIATDKTGTLTENRMDVRRLDAEDEARALRAIVLVNDADPETGAGDPLDLGLLRYAQDHGIDAARVREEQPRIAERPFDSAWKFARVTVHGGDAGTGSVSYVKGAPEVVLPRCADAPADAAARAEQYAGEGFRVLALAWGEAEREEGLRFIGFAL